ncbi:hypothetical protein ACWERV_27270 [Streptomyces sp. NPDC004031]
MSSVHDTPPSEATALPVSAAYREAVRSAVAASRSTSARITDTVVVNSNGTGGTLTVTGAFDMAADKGAVTVRLPRGAIDHIDEVFDQKTVYLRGLSNLGQKWVETVRADTVTHYLLRAPLNDPECVLQQIAEMDHVSKAAPARINGTPTVHYSGSLGLGPLTMRMAAGPRGQLAAAKEDSWAVFADADVWVDQAGHVVRTRTTIALQNTTVTATMTLSDVGHPVTVTVPTAEATAPATSITGILPG